MPIGIDGSEWLTALLMLLTVGVGVLGIFQEHHRKDGKLTKVGWGLIAAISLLGLGTFLSGQRDRRIAEEKEHADTAERDRQFRSQMASLRGLETGMRESLGKQERLFGVANRNLGMSATLQRQAQQNTLSVLRRMFHESNRIAAERIAISVSYQCPPLGPYIDGPRIETATLIASGPSGSQISLSTNQKLNLGDGIMFHGFLGDLGVFETFPAWQAARISMRLDGLPPVGRVLNMDELLRMTDEEQERWRRVDRSISCPVTAMLLLNGRRVISAFARLRRVGEYEFDAEFDGLRIDASRLPHFAS
jgi:hypothetical protein